MRAHPYADKFPMLPDEELQELAESIRANGLRNPIVVTRDGLILDGRNRAKACEIAGVEPTVETYEGDDLAEYVLDCNVARRNMSTGARAMSTALVLVADGRRENGRWRRGSVVNPDFGINEGKTFQNNLLMAGVVLDYCPNLATRVITGDLALDAAYQQAKTIKESAEREKILARERAKREREEAKAEAERNAQIIADLTQAGATKYLDLIEEGTLTPSAAWSAHMEDTRKEREHERQIWDGRRRSYEAVSRAITTLEHGTQAAELWLSDAYLYDEKLPTDSRIVITRERLTGARDYINTLLERINR